MKTSFPKLALFKRKLLTILSFSTALFIFQACYGTPQDFENDIYISGKVTSSLSDEPISGIKILIEKTNQFLYSNSDGSFEIYTPIDSVYKLVFEDIDGEDNGSYNPSEIILQPDVAEQYLDIKMQSN